MEKPAISSSQVIQRDPILRFLCVRWKWSDTKIIVFNSSLSGFLFIVIGGIASWSYSGPGKKITSLDNLLFFVMWLAVFAPLMWGSYLWQARTAPALIASLVQNGVFGQPMSEHRQRVTERAVRLLRLMNHPAIYLVVSLVLVAFWVNEFLIAWPEQFRISSEYWFEVRWYLPIHILTWSISLYVLFLFVIRHVVYIIGISRLFGKVDVTVKPLDPDECGGLGAVGDLTKSSILIAMGLGFIAVLFALVIYWTGSDVLRRTDVLALFAIYILLVPLCLVVPILSAKRAMLRARQRALAPIAEEFQQVLSSAKISKGPSELEDLNAKLEQLQQYREIVLQAYPTSPLPLGALRKFSITATIPLISGVASVALQLLAP